MARAQRTMTTRPDPGINVTPLVDVMLVLLIIFMVTAKIIVSQGMPMDLPKAASGEEVQTIFAVELSADGETRVDSRQVPRTTKPSPGWPRMHAPRTRTFAPSSAPTRRSSTGG